MSAIFKNDIKRIFRSPFLYIIWAAVIGLGLLSLFDLSNLYLFAYKPVGGLNLFLVSFIVGTALNLAAPLLAVSLYSQKLYEDIDYGNIKYIVNRIPIKKYISQRILSTSIAGGVSIAIPMLIAMIVYCIYNPNPSATILTAADNFLKPVYYQSKLAYCLLFIINSFLFGAVYSYFSMSISTVVRNKYIAMSIPIIIYLIVQAITWLLGSVLPYGVVNMTYSYCLSFQFFDLSRYATLLQLITNYSVFVFISSIVLYFGLKRWKREGN